MFSSILPTATRYREMPCCRPDAGRDQKALSRPLERRTRGKQNQFEEFFLREQLTADKDIDSPTTRWFNKRMEKLVVGYET